MRISSYTFTTRQLSLRRFTLEYRINDLRYVLMLMLFHLFLYVRWNFPCGSRTWIASFLKYNLCWVQHYFIYLYFKIRKWKLLFRLVLGIKTYGESIIITERCKVYIKYIRLKSFISAISNVNTNISFNELRFNFTLLAFFRFMLTFTA